MKKKNLEKLTKTRGCQTALLLA